MKKLLLLAALLGVTASAFAQGTVRFANTGGTAFRVWTNDALGGSSNLMSGAGRYVFGLYASLDTNAALSSLSLVGLGTNVGINGVFSGGDPYALPNGYASGSQIRFQVRGWSIAGGASYEDALLAQGNDPLNIALGVSAVGTTTLGGGTVFTALWGTAPGNLAQGFAIRPIPEPSSIALGLLGLGAIALFRRRKQ